METSCSRVGVGPYFAGRDMESTVRVPRSRWDTRESLLDRMLLETGDDPRSAKMGSGGTLDNMTVYSLKYMLDERPSMTLRNLSRDVRGAMAELGPLWSSEDILWSWCAYRGADSVAEDEIPEGIVQPGQSARDWFSVQKKKGKEWERRARRSTRLPTLDAIVQEPAAGDAPWKTQDPLPRGMTDPQFSLLYRVTDDEVAVPSLEDMFLKFRVASWAPQGPKDMSLAIATESSESRVQVISSGLPFPWRGSFLPSTFFPFLSVGENATRTEWLRAIDAMTVTTPRIYTYHSSLGWASLEKRTPREYRVEILQKPALSLRDTDLLNRWATFMQLDRLDRFRALEDRGAYIALIFRDLPTKEFSWFALYDLLVSDPLLLHFFRLAQKPVPTTENPPGPSLELVVEPGAVHALGLQDITDPLKITASVFHASAASDGADASFIEVHVRPRFPVHTTQAASLAQFFRAVLLYASRETRSVLDGFEAMGVRKTVERLETRFFQNAGLEAPPWMDLTLLFPRIFIPHYYKSLCQAQLQPLLLTEDEAGDLPDDNKMQFPHKELTDPFGMIVQPQWYACPSPIWKFPGLKRNDHEDAILPVVPCCFKTPQGNKVKDKLLKMDLGVDVVSAKRKDNIIKKNKIIRHPGQIGIVLPLFTGLKPFFMWNYPEADLYRIGMQNSPWSFMECLQYVHLRGQSMPPLDYYPHRLINMIQAHPGLFQSGIPFRTVDDMIHAIREPGREFWIDPRIFLPFLEALYQVQVYVWAVEEDGEVQMIRSQTPRVYPRSVYILMHFGGRMNLLVHKPYPQCELLAWRPLLPYVESVSATGLRVEFETRSFPVLRHPDRMWRQTLSLSRAWRSQALLPTGNILGLELVLPHHSRDLGVMLWLPVDSCLQSLDLPLTTSLDPTNGPMALSADPQVVLAQLQGIQQAIEPALEMETSAMEISYHGDRFLVWKLRFQDSPWLMVLSKAMDAAFVSFLLKRLHPSSSSEEGGIIRRSSPPLAMLPILSMLPTRGPRDPTGVKSMKPTIHAYHFRVQERWMRVLRDVVVVLYRWYSRALSPTVPWEEKVRVFLSRHTTVRPDHYQDLSLPPTGLKNAMERCTLLQDPDTPVVCLPSTRTVSRLYYTLMWKLLHEPSTMTPLDRYDMDQTEDDISAATAEAAWASRVDRRTMVYSLRGLVELLVEDSVFTTDIPVYRESGNERFTMTVRTGSLKDMAVPAECLRIFSTAFSPHAFRCAEVPAAGLKSYVDEVCPEWAEWRDTLFQFSPLAPPTTTASFPSPEMDDVLVWDEGAGSFLRVSEVTRPVFLIPGAAESPDKWRVLLHPLFFDPS